MRPEWRVVAPDDLVRSTSFCMVFGEGRAQVDTALLEDSDMHGEADKTEKQKARGCCEGAGVDVCRRSAREVCAGNEALCDLSGA